MPTHTGGGRLTIKALQSLAGDKRKRRGAEAGDHFTQPYRTPFFKKKRQEHMEYEGHVLLAPANRFVIARAP